MSTIVERPDVAQDEINGQLYGQAELVQFYAAPNLCPPEVVALVRYRDDIAGRRILDLGCGAGRLAIYLRPLTDKYVGLDISPHMVAHCRQSFPELTFHQSDMRNLSLFADGSFDAVFGIFNVFDAVNPNDRLRTFSEIRRVLTPKGLLVFSSHNRNFEKLLAGPRLNLSRNPITQLGCAFDYLRAWVNHRRIRHRQRFEADFALVNDSAHNYSLLHYYISRAAQGKQLADCGFCLLECLDEAGLSLGPDSSDDAFSSIYYVARPSAG